MRLEDELVEGYGNTRGCRSPTDGFDVPERKHEAALAWLCHYGSNLDWGGIQELSGRSTSQSRSME